DGITRHISDNELRQLLVVNNDLEEVCRELKRRCYERGAEDNLTVVVVRVGDPVRTDERLAELEPTITPETQTAYAAQNGGQQTMIGTQSNGSPVTGSRISIPAASAQADPNPGTLNVAEPRRGGSGLARVFGVLLVLVLLAAAFYAGARFKERIPFLATKPSQEPVLTLTVPAPTPEPFAQFERMRRQVDDDPRAWLATEPQKELVNAGVQSPLDSPHTDFLYLYGRANLLSGNTDEAGKAFDAAIAKADANPSPANSTIKKESVLGLAAVSVRTQRDRWKVLNHYEELTKPPASSASPAAP
ncbi:MAG TPA: hypothetical protein VGD38_06265, partial [Pyrinomonadaceae bacterium]